MNKKLVDIRLNNLEIYCNKYKEYGIALWCYDFGSIGLFSRNNNLKTGFWVYYDASKEKLRKQQIYI